MRSAQLARILTLLGLLLSGAALPLSATRAAGAAPAESCFPQTGFCVQGRFLDYWQQHGGLAINGYPLTVERREWLEDGNTYTVQYFERARLELRPENMPPYDVLLGQFGRRFCPSQGEGAAATCIPAPRGEVPEYPAVYFAETQHNLSDATRGHRAILIVTNFRTYWETNGGLAQFGYPLSEPFAEILEDGREHTVQYFERARFETSSQGVMLGQFGRRALAEVDAGR